MSIAGLLERNYVRLQRQLMQVAEEMPADRYLFRPVAQVRSFGEQLRHVGAVQYVIAAALFDGHPPVDVGDGDSGPLQMTAKPEIIEYVRGSFSYIRLAVKSVSERNALEEIRHPFAPHTNVERLALIVGYATHGWEHYGQMVVYLRLSGKQLPSTAAPVNS